ncbi:hypothetical protein [Thiomicrospira sp.]|uniref:hypothetical protein n=1 Tax=Thiomicrospira sp. TaxID=935 RepID=UPI002F943F63
MKIQNIEIEEVNVNITLSPDVIRLLQIAVAHLSTSINNSSFSAGTPAQESAVLDNLYGLHHQMSHILNDFA